jgi:hypothetical protein
VCGVDPDEDLAIIGAASWGAVTTTLSLLREKALAKGISGPKCPAPRRVLIITLLWGQRRGVPPVYSRPPPGLLAG